MSQVHKEQLTEIENALPNRAGIDVEIFGMEGIPEDVLQAHHQRVAAQFHQAEVERQAATGNPPPGSGGGNQPAKKPKLENLSEMKRRLAEHRVKRAEGAAGGSSGGATPVGAGQPAPQSVPAPNLYVSFALPTRVRLPTEVDISQLGTTTGCNCAASCASTWFIRELHPLLRAHFQQKLTYVLSGTTPSCSCSRTRPAVLISSALRRRRRRRSLPTDRESRIPDLLAGQWPTSPRLPSGWILTAAIPGSTFTLSSATTYAHRIHTSPATRQLASPSRPPTASSLWCAYRQRAANASDAHGPPSSANWPCERRSTSGYRTSRPVC